MELHGDSTVGHHSLSGEYLSKVGFSFFSDRVVYMILRRQIDYN